MRAFVFLGATIHFIAYLDEFGHIGPFVSRMHPHFNTSPVFGLGGFVLPSAKVRAFATWFYKLKCNLLQFEIARDGIPAYLWEKKGAGLYTTKNVLTYPELRRATFRLMNRIERDAQFQIILDELKGQDDFRMQIVSEASIQMFVEARASMIEPPIQAESHLFQTLQCADWLCGLIGRVSCFKVQPDTFSELDWTAKYFMQRRHHIAPISGIRAS